jgi:tungstate transport system substrate-binding protein
MNTGKLRVASLLLVSLFVIISLITTGCASPPAPSASPAPTAAASPTATPSASPSATPSATPTAKPSASSSATPSATAAASPTKHANTEVILSSTTSVRDSGLMEKLIPLFEQKSGYKVKPIYNGSGAALALGAKGEADVLVVHSPIAEMDFMSAGNGSDRRLIMHNDFIIIGPASDPAKIKGTKTALDAFKKIAAAKATFYSRGDNSGTDATEKAIWKLAGVVVVDKSPDNPNWYIESGSAMGQLLLIASDKQGYTMSDRATYLAYKDKIALDVLVEGDPALLNLYHVIQVNPAKFPGIVNTDGAKAFADFMVGKDAQDVIGKFTDKNNVLLFVPDGGKTDADLGVK